MVEKSKPMIWTVFLCGSSNRNNELIDGLRQKHSYLQAHVGSFIMAVQFKGTWVDSGIKLISNAFHPIRSFLSLNNNDASVCLRSDLGSITARETDFRVIIFLKVHLSWLLYRLDFFIDCALLQSWAEIFTKSAHRIVLKVTWKYFTFAARLNYTLRHSLRGTTDGKENVFVKL